MAKSGESKSGESQKRSLTSRNRNFYCNVERILCYVILVSIITGYTLFMINDGPYVTEKYTLGVPVLISIIFLSTVTNQILASFKNPGIIDQEDYEKQDQEINPCQINEKEGLVPVKINGSIQTLKFCNTCKIIRPPRASHCKYCDVCVYRSDHHCPYLGNCIGLKNYKNFYYFLVSVVLLTGTGFAFALLHLLDVQGKLGSSWWDAVKFCPISLIVMAACFAGGIFPLGLAIFHTYVVCTGITSREIIKKYDQEARSFRSRNPFKNCIVTLCRTGRPNMRDIELVT